MGIEAKGGKFPYVAVVTGACGRWVGGRNNVYVFNRRAFLAADSDDEAYGIATRIGERCFPPSDGWTFREVTLVPLAGLDWIGRYNLDGVEPVSVPDHGQA